MKKKYIQPTARELDAMPTQIIASSGDPHIGGGSTEEQNVKQQTLGLEW